MSKTVEEHTVPPGLSPKERSMFLKQGMEETAEKSEKFKQYSSYLFWAATGLLAVTIGLPFMGITGGVATAVTALGGAFGASTALAQTVGTGIIMGITGISGLAAAAGNMHFGGLASAYSEKNDRLYSKKQAEDIAAAISRQQQQSQTPVLAAAPTQENPIGRSDGRSWAEASASRNGLARSSSQNWGDYARTRQAQAGVTSELGA